MIGSQGARKDFLLHIMNQRIHHGFGFAPSINDGGNIGVDLRIRTALILLCIAVSRFAEFRHLIAQMAHRAALKRELLEIYDVLQNAKRRRRERCAADGQNFLVGNDVELELFGGTISIHFLKQDRLTISRSRITIEQNDVPASAIIEITTPRAANKKIRGYPFRASGYGRLMTVKKRLHEFPECWMRACVGRQDANGTCSCARG